MPCVASKLAPSGCCAMESVRLRMDVSKKPFSVNLAVPASPALFKAVVCYQET